MVDDDLFRYVFTPLAIALIVYLLTSLYTSRVSRIRIHHELRLNRYDKLHDILREMLIEYRFLLTTITKIQNMDDSGAKMDRLRGLSKLLKLDYSDIQMDDRFYNVFYGSDEQIVGVKDQDSSKAIGHVITFFGTLLERLGRSAMVQISAIELLRSKHNVGDKAFKLIFDMLDENTSLSLEYHEKRLISDDRIVKLGSFDKRYHKIRKFMQLDLEYDF